MNQDILNSGFIPEVICEQLPEGFEDIELLAEELPKVLANEQITDRISKLEIEKDISKLSLSELERAMLLYSYIGHAYMWGKSKVENVIPIQISKTWYEISQKLHRPPILSYASYALNNWKIADPDSLLMLKIYLLCKIFLVE